MRRPVKRDPAAPGRAGLLLALVALLAPALSSAQVKERRRLEACREVLEELLGGEERIPRDLLDKAECVAVVPSAKKFALGFGGRWGKGAVVCRGQGGRGSWGAPLMISIGGGSFGLQIGGQAADYVFLVMNPKGIDYLMRSQFTLGADAAVAAGPVGRTGSAGTDLRMRAEILSYSRTRGLFAGALARGLGGQAGQGRQRERLRRAGRREAAPARGGLPGPGRGAAASSSCSRRPRRGGSPG